MKIPLLLNTFSHRFIFLDLFFYYYKKNFTLGWPLYLTTNEETYISKETLQIELLYYENIKETSTKLHETHSRYFRHYYTLKYLKEIGHTYIFNYLDDAWMKEIDTVAFDNIHKYLEQFDADRIDITGPEPLYKLIPLNSDVSVIDKNQTITWYHTNQPAIWKIDSLLRIYEALGPCADTALERYGSDYCRENNYTFLCHNRILLKHKGVFQRNVGFTADGVEMLKEYCISKSLNYTNVINKFNVFL